MRACRCAALLAAICAVCAAQQPPGKRKAVEEALALQRRSVAAQWEAVARQQASVGRQGRAAVPSASLDGDCEAMPKEQVQPLVTAAAGRQGLSPQLLNAVIEQESGFRPCAVSPKGAMGLMQLMPATAERLSVEDPFDARENIDSGARLLRELLLRFGGNLELALGAYNAGPARIDAAGGLPQIPETMNYVRSILGKLARVVPD
jgi:soluble lytic murein transglycosylase-like protein